MSWINLSALWKIAVFGLLAGAGLPAIFATGLYTLSWGPRTAVAGPDGGTVAGDPDSDRVIGGNTLGIVIAVILFLVVLAAIGWGIYEVYQIGHPAPAAPAKPK